MFSFPNKERRFDWVNEAVVTNGSLLPEADKVSNSIESEHSGPRRRVVTEMDPSLSVDGSSLYFGSVDEGREHAIIEMSSGVKGQNRDVAQLTNEHLVLMVGGLAGGDGVSPGGVGKAVVLGGALSGIHAFAWGNEFGKGATTERDDQVVMIDLEQGAEPNRDGVRRRFGDGERPTPVATVGQVGYPGMQNKWDNNGDPVVIHIGLDEDDVVLVGPSRYLKRYHDTSYIFCVSSFKLFQREKAETWCCLAGRISQKVIYWPGALASLIESVCLVKSYYLDILLDGKYNSYVHLAFGFACLFVKLYTIYMLSFKKKKTERMLKAMRDYENAYPLLHGAVPNWKMKLVTLLAVSTLAFSGAITAFGTGAESSQDVLLDSSYELSRDIFVWKANFTGNPRSELFNEYALKTTPTTVGMGIFVLFRDVANYLLVGVIFDLIIVVGSVLYAYVAPFTKEVKAVTPNIAMENVEEFNRLQARREEVWRRYVMLRAVKDEINDLYDPLLKLLHMRNLTTYAFFMTLLILGNRPWIIVLLFAVNLVKAEIGYYIAGRIAEVNDAMTMLIHNWGIYGGKIRVDGMEMDTGIILDQITKYPIGLGKGSFLIHHAFHFKFVAFVWSVFFTMADEQMSSRQ